MGTAVVHLLWGLYSRGYNEDWGCTLGVGLYNGEWGCVHCVWALYSGVEIVNWVWVLYSRRWNCVLGVGFAVGVRLCLGYKEL